MGVIGVEITLISFSRRDERGPKLLNWIEIPYVESAVAGYYGGQG
jgi:hypothetical protein